MSYYITKYALTVGIIEVSETDFSLNGETCRIYGKLPKQSFASGYSKNEWAFSAAAAAERAEEMRIAKIASLKKSIAKMEKLKF